MKVETPYSLLSHTWFSNWLLKIIEKFILIRLVLLLLLSKKISTNDIHLGWRVGVSRKILKVDHLKIFSTKISKQQILMWFFLSKICTICRNQLKEKIHRNRKIWKICWTTHYHVAAVEMWHHFSIFRYDVHLEWVWVSDLEWRAGLSDHTRTITEKCV